MPTELDHLWKIDVKKASASPPLVVRQRLRTIIDKIAGASNRVYKQRGARLSDPGITPFWSRRIDKNQISFEINREHPTISGFFEELDGGRAACFDSLLNIIEKTFPMDAVYSDISSEPESVDTGEILEDELRNLIAPTVRYLRDSKQTDDQIIQRLSKVDPFRTQWKVAEAIVRYELGEERRA
jgi:hypothetical protein